jgi:hypothetical protein
MKSSSLRRGRPRKATGPLLLGRALLPAGCFLAGWFLVGCSGPEAGLEAEGRSPGPGQNAPTLVAADGSVDWNTFHDHAQTVQIMGEFAELYPHLTNLRVIGQSYLGADIHLMEVTNFGTGPAEEKPAMYIDGGIHARELTSSQVALYALAYLLNQYGNDPRITELLDTRAFYIRPKFNPDGSDLALHEDQWLRSTVRPLDENEDGIADSDPPMDLDGDGRILQMRVPDPAGEWRKDTRDPRIMVRREAGDAGPFYRLEREGIDGNGDGRIASDGIGGIDMNRNFPRNWDRAHIQDSGGAFPLSEPETYATVEFIDAHRNIYSIYHGHTSGGFVFRLPSAMNPDSLDRADLDLIVHLGDYYTRDTGRPVVPSATHPTDRRYGTLIQWGYSDHGIIGWVPEFSPPPEQWVPDLDGDGEVTEHDWHLYNEREFGGRYFQDWTPYDHPQLGEVEIGGWWTLFWGQNPPWERVERELEVQIPWILHLAEQGPLLEMDEPRIIPLGEGIHQVEVTVRNTGFLPTNLTERGLEGRVMPDGRIMRQVARSPLVILEVEGGTVLEGNGRVRIPHMAGSSPFSPGVSGRERTVRFQVGREAGEGEIRVVVEGEKGGTLRWGPIPLP